MKCPVCKSELIVNGQERLETLMEHVDCREPSLKDSYICSMKECPTHKAGVRWNESGELYCKDFYLESKLYKYIDNNNAPFGSFQRQLNVEIYKKDENKKFNIFGWTVEIKYKYKSNENGDILKKWPKINLWQRDHTLYIPGIHMFLYCVKKHFAKYNPDYYDDFVLPVRKNDDWWRYAAVYVIRALDRKGYKKYLQDKNKPVYLA
jgi:uncharacterized protein YbaR (Trm112 family)